MVFRKAFFVIVCKDINRCYTGIQEGIQEVIRLKFLSDIRRQAINNSCDVILFRDGLNNIPNDTIVKVSNITPELLFLFDDDIAGFVDYIKK